MLQGASLSRTGSRVPHRRMARWRADGIPRDRMGLSPPSDSPRREFIPLFDLLTILASVAEDPYLYLPLLFIFVILATIILPIPVELGLLNPYLPAWWLLAVLAAARGVSAWLVYPLGGWIGAQLDRWAGRSAGAARILRWVQDRVGSHGYWALLGILSIPFMVDTAAIYAFTVLNPRSGGAANATPSAPDPNPRPGGRLRIGGFTVVNVIAGFVRGLLFLAVPLLLGWK